MIEELGYHLPLPVENLALLTPYAVIGRYGGIEDEIITIEEAIAMMNNVLEWTTELVDYRKG